MHIIRIHRKPSQRYMSMAIFTGDTGATNGNDTPRYSPVFVPHILAFTVCSDELRSGTLATQQLLMRSKHLLWCISERNIGNSEPNNTRLWQLQYPSNTHRALVFPCSASYTDRGLILTAGFNFTISSRQDTLHIPLLPSIGASHLVCSHRESTGAASFYSRISRELVGIDNTQYILHRV